MWRTVWTWAIGLAFLFIAVPIWIAIWFVRGPWLGVAQIVFMALIIWYQLIVPARSALAADTPATTPLSAPKP